MRDLANKLNEELKKSEVAIQYFSLKEELLNDEYVLSLLKVIEKTQKEMKQCLKDNDIKSYNIKRKSLEVLKDEFINLPLVNNYINIKKELYDLLEQVVGIISVQ